MKTKYQREKVVKIVKKYEYNWELIMFKVFKNKRNITVENFLSSVCDSDVMAIDKEILLNQINNVKKKEIGDLLNKVMREKNDKKRSAYVKQISGIICEEYYRIVIEELSVDNIRNEIVSNNKDEFNKRYIFFYDETNNFRKFYLKNEDRFNESEWKYFVLGGLCYEDKAERNFEIEELICDLQLQSNTHEVKATHVFREHKNLFECLNSTRLNNILKWIINNKIYIHFEIIDHMKIVAEELSNRIFDDNEKEVGIDLIYRIVEQNIENVRKIMYKYTSSEEFCDVKGYLEEWKNLVKKCIERDKSILMNNDFANKFGKMLFYDWIIEKIELAQKSSLGQKQINKSFIESYLSFYQIMPMLFLRSKHIYDEEPEIQKELSLSAHFYAEKQKIENYEFWNSKKSQWIQLSDVVVYLIEKLFEYIRVFELGDKMQESVSKMVVQLDTQTKRENFIMLMKILRYSYKKHNQFIRLHSVFSNWNVLTFLMGIKEITEEKVEFERVE